MSEETDIMIIYDNERKEEISEGTRSASATLSMEEDDMINSDYLE